jgi:toxin YoeB
MGIFRLEFSKRFLREYHRAKKDTALAKRVDYVLGEISANPTGGIGKIERIKGNSGNRYSRRVDKKNRIIYDVLDGEKVIIFLRCLGHYDDH